MSVLLKIDNFTSVNTKEKTSLAQDYATGVTSLSVENNQNIATNDYILIGNPGSETSEIVAVSSITGGTGLIVGATTQPHNRFDPVTALRGNKLKIYSAPNVNGTQPADSAFTTLVATVDIDPDQLQTNYTDASGDSTKWYKYTFYNSANTNETGIDASGSVRGGTTNNYVSVDAIRQEAGFQNNRNISDSLVDQFRKQAQSEIDGALTGLYTLPFTTPVNSYIERITMMLAAGYLQISQYGQQYNTDATGTNNKVAWAESQIEKLKSGQITLTDVTGTTTAAADTGGFHGYPNADTTAATDGSEDFMFKRSDIYGYGGRKY